MALRTSPPPGFDPEDAVPPTLPEGPWRISSLALDVAGRCNLACRYCFEGAKQPKRRSMSIEILEKAWHFLFSDGRAKKGTSIRLGSGEPLLAIHLLKRLAQLRNNRDESNLKDYPAFFLTTNGTLANKEVREWLVSSGWYVKFSLDGPKSIHDKWRIKPNGEGTFEQVADAVVDLARRIPDRFSVTATLCRGTDPSEVFEAIGSFGVRRIELVPVVHHLDKVLPGPAEIKEYEIFVENYARQYLESTQVSRFPILVRFANFVVRVMGYNVRSVPCDAGRSFLGVGPNGNFYPCFRFIGLEQYRMGNLMSGIDYKAAKAFQQGPGRPYEKRERCSKCWAAPLCGGPCFAVSEIFGPDNKRLMDIYCAYALADARNAVWLVNELRKHNPELLLSFLPGAKDFYGIDT